MEGENLVIRILFLSEKASGLGLIAAEFARREGFRRGVEVDIVPGNFDSQGSINQKYSFCYEGTFQ